MEEIKTPNYDRVVWSKNCLIQVNSEKYWTPRDLSIVLRGGKFGLIHTEQGYDEECDEKYIVERELCPCVYDSIRALDMGGARGCFVARKGGRCGLLEVMYHGLEDSAFLECVETIPPVYDEIEVEPNGLLLLLLRRGGKVRAYFVDTGWLSEEYEEMHVEGEWYLICHDDYENAIIRYIDGNLILRVEPWCSLKYVGHYERGSVFLENASPTTDMWQLHFADITSGGVVYTTKLYCNLRVLVSRGYGLDEVCGFSYDLDGETKVVWGESTYFTHDDVCRVAEIDEDVW